MTESIGGIGEDGRPLVTKTSFRYLQTLYNLGPGARAEHDRVLDRRACRTGSSASAPRCRSTPRSIQYESDELHAAALRRRHRDRVLRLGDGVGKQMQFFGARVNLAKALLYAINGGRDEVSGSRSAPAPRPSPDDGLDFDDVDARFDRMLDWLAETYVHALNCIHWMHDKYAYERIEMALHDREILRTMACGIAGLSVAADSLSAIQLRHGHPVRDERGLVVDYRIEGEFPTFGNDDDRADEIAVDLVAPLHGEGAPAPDLPQRACTRSRC